MRTKKTYIILIAILLIFFIVMFVLFGLDNFIKSGYDTTIVVGEDTVFSYNNKKWFNVRDYTDLNWKKYEIYSNNEKVGKYYLWYSDKWYAFDDKKNAVLIDGDLLAYNSNHDIDIQKINTQEIDNYDYIYSVFNDKDISTSSEYTSKYMISFDFDNDGIVEDFYLVSNAFIMGSNPDKIFSIVFMVKNDTIYNIYTDISKNIGFNGCKPYFNSFIDVDNDSKYEFILSCSRYSTSSTNHMLYGFKDNKFKILISNNK